MDLSDYEYETELKAQIIDEDNTDESVPFSYSLTSYGIDFDINGIVRRYKNGTILIPDFQRELVWSSKQCSKFIESILLGIPIPGLFFSVEEKTNNLLVIDGQQRINALTAFYTGKYKERNFKLRDVHKDYEGKTYDTLTPDLQNKIDDTIIHATLVKPEDPKVKNNESIYLIFERLNSGGMNLYPQEIRSAINGGRLQELIVDLKQQDAWKNNFKINPKRKKDEEIILRFISLFHDYLSYKGNMKYFLNEFMSTNKELDSIDYDEYKDNFIYTANIISEKIDMKIFKPTGTALNIAILDSIFVGITLRVEKIKTDESKLKPIIENLIIDKVFKDSIFTGKTHHKDSVINRIKKVLELIDNAY